MWACATGLPVTMSTAVPVINVGRDVIHRETPKQPAKTMSRRTERSRSVRIMKIESDPGDKFPR
jgi:hypothetical protein